MSGLVLLLAFVMIVVIVVWSVVNDNVPINGKTRWLLAMKDDESSPKHKNKSGPTQVHR